jgi:hypothetical protein
MAGGKIFINYRREDGAGYARSLFDRINARFPKQVFMDVGGSIEFGLDFAEEIRKAVSSCDALIVLIGRHWLNVKDASGRRRLDDPGDFVGLEIATALKRNVRVIPALVGGASMPSEEDLPPELKPLTRRQAVLLSDQDWDHTVERLIETLEGALRAAASAAPNKPAGLNRPGSPLARVGGGVLAALLLAGALFYKAHRRPSPAPPAPNVSLSGASVSPAVPLPHGPAERSESAVQSPPESGPHLASPANPAGAHSGAPLSQGATRGAYHRPARSSGSPAAENFDALVVDGDVAYQGNQYRKALDKYFKAYRMKPDDPGVRRRIRTTLTLLGRPGDAQKYQ